jgi:hypothetical protein
MCVCIHTCTSPPHLRTHICIYTHLHLHTHIYVNKHTHVKHRRPDQPPAAEHDARGRRRRPSLPPAALSGRGVYRRDWIYVCVCMCACVHTYVCIHTLPLSHTQLIGHVHVEPLFGGRAARRGHSRRLRCLLLLGLGSSSSIEVGRYVRVCRWGGIREI